MFHLPQDPEGTRGNLLDMTILRAFFFCLALSAPALAYLDPVTGNILVQALLAAFAGIALSYHRLKIWFQGLFGKKTEREKKVEEKQTQQEGVKDHASDVSTEPTSPKDEMQGQ